MNPSFRTRVLIAMALLASGCKDSSDTSSQEEAQVCTLAEGDAPNYASSLGCLKDYQTLASQPTDASIPGATSVKTLVDRSDDDTLYFQNSKKYCVHWDFASNNLSGGEHPVVPELSRFNTTEYYSPDRRFILGALSYYEGPDKWVYEISPYDTADAAMITTAFETIKAHTWLGDRLSFHPTSAAVEQVSKQLTQAVPITTTDELYQGVDYQPLNPGTSTGILRFKKATEVAGSYTPFREIVVLDSVPNDISIVAGIITAEFQTPLAHINVLSVNRGTPNMALRDATENEQLRSLEGKWVELKVEPFGWTVQEIGEDAANQWWEEHKPTPLSVQPKDTTVTELSNVKDMLDETLSLKAAIARAIPVYGAKATNYGGLALAQEQGAFAAVEEVNGSGPIAPGFGVPMFYYDQFMVDNDLYASIEGRMADDRWSDPTWRAEQLEAFKDEMRATRMRTEVVDAIVAKAAELFPGENLRFRSSTNSEDLGKFTGAGLYNSETGKPSVANPEEDSVEWAIKKVWSQVWNPRAYEEREFFSMNHLDVGMALLVHANFPNEEAQGVAITNNPFDSSGLEQAFYVNAQTGTNDVVSPDPGVLADAYLQYFSSPGQPVVYMQHSTLIPEGTSVLSADETTNLGLALDAIHRYFASAYAETGEWYALDVEWKFDDKNRPGQPQLFIKQARPYPAQLPEVAGACQLTGE